MNSDSNVNSSNRLLCIDALRGFDMLMISGLGAFIYLLHGKTNMPWVDAVALQFEHTTWHGFTFYDFIFPLFLFIAGVSIPFSLSKARAMGMSKSICYRKAWKRMLILFALGVLEKNLPFPFFDWAEIRLGGVLQRIGIAGFITTVLYINFSAKSRAICIMGILLTYYALMFLVPVPGFGAGDLSFEGNLHGWLDRMILPGRLIQKTFDENGILTQLPAMCLTLLGSLAGDLLKDQARSAYQILRNLIMFGMVCLCLALLWNLHFPINKRLWSSSFILLTGGLSFLLLALFYYMIDILKYTKWTFVFMVIGMNSITIYLVSRFFDFTYSSRLLFQGLYVHAAAQWHPVWESLGALVLVWLFLYALYKKNIFLKI